MIGDVQTHSLQADENVILHGHCISLSDEALYEESVSSWQDTQAISSRSILQNIHISLDNTMFSHDVTQNISAMRERSGGSDGKRK